MLLTAQQAAGRRSKSALGKEMESGDRAAKILSVARTGDDPWTRAEFLILRDALTRD